MSDRTHPDGFAPIPRYTQKQLAGLLGVSMTQLLVWRKQQRGPAYRKQVGRIVYDVADVKDWLEKTRWG